MAEQSLQLSDINIPGKFEPSQLIQTPTQKSLLLPMIQAKENMIFVVVLDIHSNNVYNPSQ